MGMWALLYVIEYNWLLIDTQTHTGKSRRIDRPKEMLRETKVKRFSNRIAWLNSPLNWNFRIFIVNVLTRESERKFSIDKIYSLKYSKCEILWETPRVSRVNWLADCQLICLFVYLYRATEFVCVCVCVHSLTLSEFLYRVYINNYVNRKRIVGQFKRWVSLIAITFIHKST